jgi:hypothetical protein
MRFLPAAAFCVGARCALEIRTFFRACTTIRLMVNRRSLKLNSFPVDDSATFVARFIDVINFNMERDDQHKNRVLDSDATRPAAPDDFLADSEILHRTDDLSELLLLPPNLVTKAVLQNGHRHFRIPQNDSVPSKLPDLTPLERSWTGPNNFTYYSLQILSFRVLGFNP